MASRAQVTRPLGIGQKGHTPEQGPAGGCARLPHRLPHRVERCRPSRRSAVEEIGQHGQTAHAVDQRVMDLHHESGAVTHTFDQHCLPQRQGGVEPARRHRLGHVEDVPQGAGPGQAHTPEVRVQIEGLVGHELRAAPAQAPGDGSW